MTHATPIPVAIFGKDPKIARSVCEKLLPDFEPIHVCLDLPTALRELPPLFAASSTNSTSPPPPASGLGTNAYTLDPAKHRAKVPQAVFFGGKFSDDEYHAIVDAVKRAVAAAATSTTASTSTSPFTAAEPSTTAGHLLGTSGAATGAGGSSVGAAAAEKPRTVHFIKVQKRDVLAAGSFGPNPDVICKVFRKKMAAAVDKAEREVQSERERQHLY
ncbi:hypothetical protein C8A01DRAFT_46453 [Parachaetomium inaequale]|uniref:Uncharacterized protein n=1 Tax=Parachaetomium inaequale TaxID=2588326 RepID=A0AAN6PHP1_9PEZI|nr:hypothetical protein C8A01DRAFT_46453 [Parachaetomium inaequale]